MFLLGIGFALLEYTIILLTATEKYGRKKHLPYGEITS